MAGLVAVLALTGCGGAQEGHPRAAAHALPVAATGSATTPAPAPGTRRARTVVGTLSVLAAPEAGAKVVATLPATTALGSTRVLLVLRTAGEWVQVALPVRPNGSTGWVRSSDVVVEDVDTRIVVDLAARMMELQVNGRPLWRTQVAVGAPGTPTPPGSFFVTDRVVTTDPKGAYGPFALGLSAHSPVLTQFGDGDAQIGIHGTNEPRSLGTATTHGCIRVPDTIATKLESVPLGTPVDIVVRPQ